MLSPAHSDENTPQKPQIVEPVTSKWKHRIPAVGVNVESRMAPSIAETVQETLVN